MLKYILLVLSGAGAIALLPQATLSNPLDNRDLSCYMETSSGQVLDLNRLCGNSTRPPAAAPNPVSPMSRPPSLNNPGSNSGSTTPTGRDPDLLLNDEPLSATPIEDEPYFTPVVPIDDMAGANSRISVNNGRCVVLDAQGRRCP
ncbi:hypothetical protein [Thermoleptolyngbya sp. C42_A2020_037]|uniref:hypothetical protein n=1 Tax=Thermoleptolyngbya sp. C42_A2020_037 TaxID=2747799 RepID=UPI0019FD558A|nr:hypothetical protein [Thermoleptolyngbya sp. C42_A2020_037]MBF2084793.1 hypothetical protein [Thermoleptolyngbya sp. C42_A2020_037]